MDRRRLGQTSLRADAAYCAVTSACLAVFTGPASGAVGLPVWTVLAVAAGTAVWAFSLARAARGAQLRPWLVRVLTANIVAAVSIAGLAVTRPRDAVSVLLLAVALEVAAFAASQAVALRRPA